MNTLSNELVEYGSWTVLTFIYLDACRRSRAAGAPDRLTLLDTVTGNTSGLTPDASLPWGSKYDEEVR